MRPGKHGAPPLEAGLRPTSRGGAPSIPIWDVVYGIIVIIIIINIFIYIVYSI